MGADRILGSKRGQNGAKSVKMGLKMAKKTCFGDFSAIMDPPDPVATPSGGKRIFTRTFNAFGEIMAPKADIFRDFMAAEVLESAWAGMTGIGPKWAKNRDFSIFGDYAC